MARDDDFGTDPEDDDLDRRYGGPGQPEPEPEDADFQAQQVEAIDEALQPAVEAETAPTMLPLPPRRGGNGTVTRSEAHTVRILQGLRLGLSYKHAAQYAGITDVTLRRWRQEDEDFDQKCDMAEGRAAAGWMWSIEKALKAGDWRAAAWKLQRRHPTEYGRTISEVTGTGGGPVQIQEVVVRIPAPTPGVDNLREPADNPDL